MGYCSLLEVIDHQPFKGSDGLVKGKAFLEQSGYYETIEQQADGSWNVNGSVVSVDDFEEMTVVEMVELAASNRSDSSILDWAKQYLKKRQS